MQEALTFAVPNGLSRETAALTEPLAVGLHAVRRSGISKKQVAVVIGCGPAEFRETLHLLADGVVRADPLITGRVGLEGVEAAFAALADPEAHAKILIDPASSAVSPV